MYKRAPQPVPITSALWITILAMTARTRLPVTTERPDVYRRCSYFHSSDSGLKSRAIKLRNHWFLGS
jgi:hypothetical protein